jgi:tetratricopeptide (TPR) repeat protein
MEAGGETLEAARWFARAAHWAGHTRPQDALRLWRRVTALAAELDESDETLALAVSSRMLQLEYAWRLGMEREEAEALAVEATEIAERIGDVHALAMLKLLTAARPGVAERSVEWVSAAREAMQLADETGDPALRIAIRSAGAYAHMCAGDLDALERTAGELLDLTGGDPGLGAGIVVDCPIAWALMAKSVALRERDRPEEAQELLDEALRLAREHDDPETESWARGSKSLLVADRGEFEAALALARRNCELTEQLGDHQLGVHRRDQVLEGLGARFEHLDDPLGRNLAGEALHHHLDLLADEVFEGGLVAQGVVDGEADLLVVAAGAEAADRLDDLDVRR